MARIGGRSNWIAVPAGMLCVAVVAALVWLALPMFPLAVTWVGDSLRAGTIAREAPEPEATPADIAIANAALDCRNLYPDSLWSELTWTGGALLNQSAGPPATTLVALTDALAPSPRVTCAWRLDTGGGIVTTLAAVGADAGTIADAALRGQGFSCTVADDLVRCTRSQGDVVEAHTLRGGLWLSTLETSWHPEDYGTRLESYVWG